MPTSTTYAALHVATGKPVTEPGDLTDVLNQLLDVQSNLGGQ